METLVYTRAVTPAASSGVFMPKAEFVCAVCGKLFMRYPAQVNGPAFCSRACSHVGRAQPTRADQPCEGCGKLFHAVGPSRFCSRDCANARHAKPKITVECANPECSNTKEVWPSTFEKNKHNRFFCSKECAHKIGVKPRGVLVADTSRMGRPIKHDPIPGTRYTKLVVLEQGYRLPVSTVMLSGRKHVGSRAALCLCDCGNRVVVAVGRLVSGNTKSCGCLHGVMHGLSNHYLASTWYSMLKRCENSSIRGYHRYGGRGISVCSAWHDLKTFISDMEKLGPRPDGWSMDRINNDGNYEPANVRWASPAMQLANRGDL